MNCAFLQTLQSKLLTILVGAVLFVAPLSVLAQFNPEINYQGKLTDSTGMAVPDGTYNMNFWLVQTSGGATSTAVWSEVRTGGNQVQVTNGLFSVMLGEVSTLVGVDFDQELYLAVEIGGTGGPSWDGELLPRKILGAVPAAFYAETAGTADLASDAELLGGVASSSFLRSDAADEMTASSTSPILSIIQNGVGKILALFSGVTEVFTVLSNGNVGVGTTTPSSTFAVDGNTILDGNLTITGGLYDNNNATGSVGDILVSTGNGINWNATSSLGLGNGTFLGLSDTPGSYTANRVFFTNGAGNAITDSDNFVFNGTNLAVGTTTLSSRLTVDGDIAFWGIQTNGEPVFAGEVWEDRNTESGVGSEVMYDADIGPSGEMIAVASGGIVVTSTDGGDTWTDRSTAAGTTGGTSLFASAIGPSGEMIAVGTTGYIRTSTDGGASWTNRTSAAGSGSTAIRGVAIGPSGEILAVGSSGYVRTSVDGGASWTNRATAASSGSNTLYVAAIGPSGEMIIGGSSGYLRISTDGGASWTNRATEAGTSGFTLNEADFGSGGEIILVGSNGYVRTSTDGGANWTDRNTAAGAGSTTLEDAAFGPDDEMIVVGSDGYVRVSTDGGANWTDRKTEAGTGTTSLRGTDIGPDGEMIVVGGLGFIITSFDGVLDVDETIPYLASNNGSVGVGTTTPSARLDVWGDFKVGTSSIPLLYANTASQLLGIGTSTGTSKFTVQGTAGSDIVTISSSAGASLMTVTEAGNIGIGTTTPGNLLTVAGNTYIGGELSIAGALRDGINASGTEGMILQTTGTSTRWVATSTLGVGNGTFLGLSDTISSFTANRILYTSGSAVVDSANFVFDGTNLGIGTTSPTAKLDVYGDFKVGTSSTPLMYANTAAQQVAFGTSAIVTDIDGEFAMVALSGSADGRDPLLVLNEESENQGASGRIMFTRTSNGTDRSMGVIDFQNSGRIEGRTDEGDNVAGSLRFSTDEPGAGTGIVERMRITSSGNVGIGTTTPGSKLTVAGDFYLTGALRDGLNASGTEGMILQTTGTSTRWVATSTLGYASTFLGLSDTISSFTANRVLFTSGSAVVDSADFVFDGTNLGIGTSTPNNRIQVLDLIEFDDVDFVTQLGYQAGQNLVSGAQWNTFVGYQAGFSSSTASTNAADNNTGIGYLTLYSNTSGFRNTAVGISALQNNTSGSNNTANGAGALLSNTSGASNSAFGSNALQNNTTGYFNSGIGVGALQSNTTGYQNTAVGLNALTANTSGLDNTAVGVYTLQSNTTGSQNVAFGRSTLQNNTTASNNTAFGFRALATVTVGGSNTAIGASALESNLTGLNNTAVGFQAGFDINTATSTGDNTLIGYNTGRGIVTGVNNTILGANVTGLSSSLSNNIIIADGAGNRRINVDSSGNVGIGTTTPTARLSVVGDAYITGALRDGLNASGTQGMVLQTTGTSTRWVATSTLGFAGSLFTDGGATTYLTAVGDNLAIGTTTATSRLTVDGSMSVTGNVDIPTTNLAGTAGVLSVQGERFIHGYTLDNTWGVNQFMGYQSGNFTLGSSTEQFAGIDNLGIGRSTLSSLTEGSNNVAVGQGAMNDTTTGGSNTAVGWSALQLNTTGSGNSAVGRSAMVGNTTGVFNSALGNSALEQNTTGERNVGIGAFALLNNTTGNWNVAVGQGALSTNVNGEGNVAVGQEALQFATSSYNTALGMFAGNTITTGGSNTILGSNSGDGITTGENNTILGANVTGLSSSLSNNIIIADGAGNRRINVDSSGNVGIGTTTPSSRLSVVGDFYLTGALRDGLNASGTSGMVLQSTGTSTRWVATSTLGFSSGGGSLFTDGGAVTYLTDTADNLAIGTTTAGSKLTIDGDLRLYGGINFGAETVISYVNSNIMMGGFALPGAVNNDVYSNVAIGNIAGNGLGLGWSNVFLGNGAGTSIATGSRSVIIGNEAVGGDFGTIGAGELVIIGDRAGFNLTTGGNFSTYVGFRAGENVTEGTGNTLLGYRAGDNLTTGYNNIVIGYDLEAQSVSQFETLNIGNLLFGTGVDGTGTTLSTGNIGIGTSTPGSKLTVAGDFYLTGALRDGVNASGTSGMVLQSTGTSTRWVATSTLGFSGSGATTFLALTDTPGSFTANRILYTSGSAVVDSADFTYDGTNLGLGAGDGIAINGSRILTASTTANNYMFGRLAGTDLTSGAGNILIGTEAGRRITTGTGNVLIGGTFNGSSLTTGGENTFVGSRIGSNLTTGGVNTFMGADTAFEFRSGNDNAFFGAYAGSRLATSSDSVLIGRAAGQGPTQYEASRLTILGSYAGESLATGADNNILIGYQAANNLTTGANNLVIGYDVDAPSATANNQLNIGNIIFGTGIDGTGTTLSAGNIGIGTSTPGSKLTVVGSAQFGGASNSANISAGGVLTFSGTGGYSVASNAYAFTAAAAPLAGIYFNASNLGLDFMDTTGNAANRIGIDGTNSYLNSGNVGIGTTTPGSKLTVAGDFYLTGALRDGANASGTQGMVLQSTGTSTRWVATSTLGFGSGGSLFTDGGAVTYLTDTADNLAIGTTTAGSKLTIDGDLRVYGGINFGDVTVLSDRDTNLTFGTYALGTNVDGYRNIAIGALAGNDLKTGYGNIFMGHDAGYNLSTTTGSVIIGDSAVGGNFGGTDGGDMVVIGSHAGYSIESGGNNGVMIGAFAGENVTTGGGNILMGYRAGDNITDGYGNIAIGYDIEAQSASQFQTLNVGNLLFGTGLDGSGTTLSSGNIGIGTTTPESRLAIERLGFTGAGTAGLSQYIRSTNSTLDATQYGSQLYMYASNTATSTLIGSITRVADNTTFGNTTRGLEIQADNGNNTLGENTGLAAFARTFGVRGTTVGNAGGVFEPAGVFGETEGTTQGNAIRGYSSSITSAALLKLFQDTSTFTGTGLLMNFGNAGGSFSSTTASRFIDLQNAGTSLFTVGARGMTTIGDGTTTNNAGLQIGYGGICVDNDGSCVASTTGRITAVSYTTANSDLAETYFSSDDLQTGEVVSLKGELSIERADEDNKDMVLGVVTTKPGLLLGSDDSSLTEGEDVYGVALAGRVPVRLSNENGEIKAGDKLMLSSVPGVAMKASSTGMVVGIALEDFTETRAYSDTYINQFGDDLVDPIYVPVNSASDPRINDGCYYGAGNASGEAECVPLVGTTTDAQVLEAEALAAAEAQAEALEALKYVQSERVTLPNGEQVRVGQIVMFVSLEERYLDEDGIAMVAALLAAAPDAEGNDSETETIWSRLVTLASNFVDGVLSVFTLKADRVEVQDEICVDGVCLNADDLRQLLDANTAAEEGPSEEVTESPEPETPVEEPEEIVEEVTPEEEVAETSTEPEVEEGIEEVVPEEGVEEVVEEETPSVEPEPEVVEEPEEAEEVVEEVEDEAPADEPAPEAPIEETP